MNDELNFLFNKDVVAETRGKSSTPLFDDDFFKVFQIDSFQKRNEIDNVYGPIKLLNSIIIY